VEDTLNALLEAEADQLCNAACYERTQARRDTRAGNYERKLQTMAGEVRNVSVLVAIGVGEDGYRKVLGITEGHKEDKAGWSAFLKHLKDRGLTGVRLIISDGCTGLVESAADFYPEAQWQRCTVRFYRNVFTVVPSKHMRAVADMLKAFHACENRQAAMGKANAVVEKLTAMKLKEAVGKVRDGIEEALTYYIFPASRWRCIRINNPLERIMREFRRRARVFGAFPNGKSALMLAAAKLRHIAGAQWGTKRYLKMDLLRDLDLPETRAA